VSDIDWTAWHDDGHTLTLKVELWHPRQNPDAVKVKASGALAVEVACPEGSICQRHHRDSGKTGRPIYCWVRNEVEMMGPLDFIDSALESAGLPDDWSSPVQGLEIEWRDQGEDGILWRPKGAAVEQREAA
jgi:hypothetical protein